MPSFPSISTIKTKSAARRSTSRQQPSRITTAPPNRERSISATVNAPSARKNNLTPERPSVLRKLSPGLAARMKLLDVKKPITGLSRSRSVVGRIPEDHIKELDNQHQDLSIKIQKRGRAWSQNNIQLERDRHEPLERSRAERWGSPIQPSESSADLSVAVDLKEEGDMPAVEGGQTMVEESRPRQLYSAGTQPSESDLQKYLKRSPLQNGDTVAPLPKDSPGSQAGPSANSESYFNPLGLPRTNSTYSFSKASFSNQLSQLTSIHLPDASSLSASISAIPTAPAAVRALTGSAQQIQRWIQKATEVLGGLDAEDDIEWAAAGGREGLDDVDKAVSKFETLVGVYVQAIEELQSREDIGNVGPEELEAVVTQMESTLKDWEKVRSLLKAVHEQVELAMEWEELWGVVLGDVGTEVDNLSRLIFEMEEKRHKTMVSEAENDESSGLDINELETIVEESPSTARTPANYRFSLPPAFAASSPVNSPAAKTAQDDSSLLALFARMQPLRASLDFLPMRLSMFQSRAETLFPTACEELEDKRLHLEKAWKKLEKEAEILRKELGEDRWVLVFRNAGRQAQKMCESVERSINKLQEAIDTGAHHSNPAPLAKKVESFEAKKMHYAPAIERVLAIIQKGVHDRLTVNGEILRLHADMMERSKKLTERINAMDFALERINANRNQQLRDSISSIITMDRSTTGSAIDTPGSSPASSVVMSGGNGAKAEPSTPGVNGNSKRGSFGGGTGSRPANTKRYSILPTASTGLSHLPRRASTPLAMANPNRIASPSPGPDQSSATPTPGSRPQRPVPTPMNGKPRWNSSANTNDLIIGHQFKPLSVTTPSSHRKVPQPVRAPRTGSSYSSLPLPSPLSREASSPPAPLSTATRRASHLSSTLHRIASPSPARSFSSITDPSPYSKLKSAAKQRQSLPAPPVLETASPESEDAPSNHDPGSSPPLRLKLARPVTAMSAAGRRVSMLPQPKGRSGRDSSLGGVVGQEGKDRPQWR